MPKSSLRKTREYIRFASSARVDVSGGLGKSIRQGIRTLLKMEFGVWSALLRFRRSRRTTVLVKQAVSSLQVLPFAIWNESVIRHIILLAPTPRKCTSQVGAGGRTKNGLPIPINPLSLSTRTCPRSPLTASSSFFVVLLCLCKGIRINRVRITLGFLSTTAHSVGEKEGLFGRHTRGRL